MNGRKRHLVVDTLGLLLAVVIHAAKGQDRDGAQLVLAQARARWPRRQLLWADGNYAGPFIDWVRDTCGWLLEISKRPAAATGFQVVPRRWVVARTFVWLGRYRRLSQDDAATTASSEAWITLAMIHLMLRRLEPN